MRHLSWLVVPVIVAIVGVGLSINYFKSPQAPRIDILAPTPTIIPTPTTTALPTNTPTPLPTSTPTPKPTLAPTAKPAAPSGSVSVTTPVGTFYATVLPIDLGSNRMITDTANDDDCITNCTTLSLQDFVNRNGGHAGVNGSYFCPATYPDCSAKTNSFDNPIYNSRLHKWINGGHLGWAGLSLLYVDGGGAHYHQNSTDYPSNPDAAIINYPGLVNDGNVQIDDNQSGLSDKQRAVGTKVGIGILNPQKIIVVVALNVNMQQFAHVFKALGATGALNLDTGGSTALYNGHYVYGPGRALPNAIIFANK